MKKQLKGLLYFYVSDFRYSMAIFWTILLSILVLTMAVAYFLLSIENGMMAFSLTAPIYIYCAILGYLSVKEAIPFSIKMGATRRNLFISFGIFFLSLSLLFSTIASILQEAVSYINGIVGMDNFHFLHLAYFLEDTWYSRIVIDTSIMFFLFSVMFMIGLLFYKFGLAGGGSVLGILMVMLLLGIAKGWVFDFFKEIYATIDITYFLQLIGIAFVIYLLTYIFIRRITIWKVK
ncbi:hypothetical protein [Virgibacillus halodenitrificans]|uniref:hypothetical protein n=1 Tax=Virgibacillus halodenitrificans TaxID=1482 RepID=UPI000EF4A912|nr:hypothetical protein [Virgibacillus halodenitrificans]